MKLLLDSHIVIAVVHHQTASYGKAIDQLLQSPESEILVSAAALWEIAIKHRLAKLSLSMPLEDIPDYLTSLDYELLAVDHRHAIALLANLPPTRDPFDRLLLAQCQVEGLRLVTTDRALVSHPLAWRAP